MIFKYRISYLAESVRTLYFYSRQRFLVTEISEFLISKGYVFCSCGTYGGVDEISHTGDKAYSVEYTDLNEFKNNFESDFQKAEELTKIEYGVWFAGFNYNGIEAYLKTSNSLFHIQADGSLSFSWSGDSSNLDTDAKDVVQKINELLGEEVKFERNMMFIPKELARWIAERFCCYENNQQKDMITGSKEDLFMRKKCKVCGAEVAEEAKFCHKCGASEFDSACDSSEFDNTFWENTTVLNQPDSLPQYRPPQTSKKKKTSLIIGAVVGGVVGFFLLLFVVIAIIGSGSDKKNVGQPVGSLTHDEQETLYELTEGEAVGIAEERIKRFARLESIGIVCDYEYIELSVDSDGYTWGGEKDALCSCCTTTEEAKEHLHQYLDEKYDEMFYETFLYPSPGKLYLFSGNDKQVCYREIKLQSWDNDKIIAVAEKWDDLEYAGNYRFTIEKRDGKYLITDCVETEEQAQPPEASVQTPETSTQTPEVPVQTSQTPVQTPKNDNIRIVLTWTDSNVNLQFRVDIERKNGENQYYQDGNEMRSQSGELLAKVENGALQSTLTLFDARTHYSIRVEDPDYGYTMENRIFGAEGRIRIQKGNTIISDGELALYRSYTGAWFGGVCEVEKGEIKEYDASWISAGMP